MCIVLVFELFLFNGWCSEISGHSEYNIIQGLAIEEHLCIPYIHMYSNGVYLIYTHVQCVVYTLHTYTCTVIYMAQVQN